MKHLFIFIGLVAVVLFAPWWLNLVALELVALQLAYLLVKVFWA